MRFALLSSSFLYAIVLSSQNLVPNWSFEDYSSCPDGLGQIDRASGWSSFRLSPDYMNACDVTNTMSVPTNLFGIHEAAHGNAYAGIHNYSSSTPNTREFIGAELVEALIPGLTVYVSIKVRISAFSPTNYRTKWTSDNIGIKFSMNDYYDTQDSALPNSASIKCNYVLTDTSQWITISGIYIPDSAYRFIAIGNFYSDDLTNIIEIDPNGFYPYAYSYIDAVCVSYNESECDLRNNVTTISDNQHLMVWPNPFYLVLNVSIPNNTAKLYDISGNYLATFQKQRTPLLLLLETPLENGVYCLELEQPSGLITRIRVMHVSP